MRCGCDVAPCVSGCSEKSPYPIESDANADGSGSGVAKVIEFYVPDKFRKKRLWIPAEQRGKVIEFPTTQKKSA